MEHSLLVQSDTKKAVAESKLYGWHSVATSVYNTLKEGTMRSVLTRRDRFSEVHLTA